MQLNFPIFKPLFWDSKRVFWVCRFWGRGLATNRWLMEHNWLAFDRAVQIQTWLIERIHTEQKHSCQVHLKVLAGCFASGDLPSNPPNLEYFRDLRSLYEEGRYDTMLIQLYQLDRSNDLDEDEDSNNALSPSETAAEQEPLE